MGQVEPIASGPASATTRTSIWSAIHPRLPELIAASIDAAVQNS
jgi:hypothetical protein